MRALEGLQADWLGVVFARNGSEGAYFNGNNEMKEIRNILCYVDLAVCLLIQSGVGKRKGAVDTNRGSRDEKRTQARQEWEEEKQWTICVQVPVLHAECANRLTLIELNSIKI